MCSDLGHTALKVKICSKTGVQWFGTYSSRSARALKKKLVCSNLVYRTVEVGELLQKTGMQRFGTCNTFFGRAVKNLVCSDLGHRQLEVGEHCMANRHVVLCD